MVRRTTEEDLGLRVLYDGTGDIPGPEAEGLVDIVAVHGMGAHPDDTWCQKIDSDGGGGVPVFVNWLEDPRFLPAVAPRARIMRYGYNSQWFGEDAIKTKMSDISQTFLFELKDCRKADQGRPLILVGHSFGGLVLLKILVDSHIERERWPGIYDSTVGLVFLGTPFRGTHDSLSQGEILKRAQEHFTGTPVHGENLEILRAGGESLTDLVDTYLRISRQSVVPRVVCFYEQKASDVGRILGKDPDKAIPSIILVDESSGSLDLGAKSDKYALPRTHFNIQKFGSPRDQGFRLVRSVIQTMVEEGPELVSTRANCVPPRLRVVLGVRPRLWVVPFERNRSFVGRDTILQELLKKADPCADTKYCQRTVLEGLGGIGKTQIALEAAYRIRDKHPDCSVFWVPAVDATSFENAYREIGRKLKIKGIDDDKADVKALVKAALSHQDSGTWLLIVDNADDTKLLLDRTRTASSLLGQYLPSIESGSILFTTRNHQLAVGLVNSRANDILSVNAMSDTEARELLLSGLKDEQMRNTASIESLLDCLVNLPLAIKQASAYMAKQQISTVEYLELYGTSDQDRIDLLQEDYIDHHRYENIKNPVATTWLISFRQISNDNSLAADYLRIICFFTEKDIPLSLLPSAAKKQALEAFRTLKAYAFITQRDAQGSFDIHRLVQIAARSWLQEKGESRVWATEALLLVAEVFPSPEHENRGVWMRYLPHAQSVLQFSGAIGVMVDGEEAEGNLMHSVGESFRLQGKYEEAEAMHRQALELSEKVLGREHPSTLTSMNNLAGVLDSQGRYEEAEAMHRQALKLSEKVLGREHPSTLTSMNNLAVVLDSQGRYEEAEAMHRQALKLREKVLGREHPSTLTSMNNLARVLGSQGRYDDAEAIRTERIER